MGTEFRVPTGWMNYDLGVWKRTELSTNQPVDDEIFASLEYISEINKVGLKFFRDLRHTNPRKSLLCFRAFIRQAKSFYYSAKELNYRASTLLYYYSFLNLAKAYVTISDENKVSGKIIHGLKYEQIKGGLKNQGVFVTREEGVFHVFYEKETLTKVPKKLKLNIKSLLGYCSDVAYEYETAGFGFRKIIPGKVRIIGDNNRRKSWPLIAIARFSFISQYKKTLKPFNNYFEQITPEKGLSREAFDISAETYPSYTFFQSKQEYEWIGDNNIPIDSIKKDFLAALKNLYNPVLYDDKYDFCLSLPLQKNLQIPMNEQIAIYIIMFYLGSLVRYNPSYLENILNSKDAWIIERFAKSSPETFLRCIANAIIQKDLIYRRR